MPLVIIEGSDGSGKTTLASRLLKGTGQPTLLVKRSGPPGDIETLRFQSAWIAEQGQSGLNIIADRHPMISETIYAPVVRKVTPLWTQAEALGSFQNVPESYRPLIIYCRAPLKRMTETSRVEDQMAGVHDQYIALVSAYDDFMMKLARRDFEVYRFDFTEDPNAERILKRVTQFFMEKQ